MKKKIVIVGGGTAGWSGAALLSRGNRFDITIIDPSTIPTIGVGESTLPHINQFHFVTGMEIFKDPSWLSEVDGTLKFTIEFAEFSKGGYWIHPFSSRASNDVAKFIIGLVEDWKSQPEYVAKTTMFGELRTRGYMSHEEFCQFTKDANTAGYHIDAAKYTSLLKRESIARGCVEHLNLEVNQVITDGDRVTKLIMSDGSEITADLFIDCTGIRSLLIDAVGSEFKSVKDRLFVDTALATRLPYKNREVQLRNTTYCHALSTGWVFNVPLTTRIGTGYVFDSTRQSLESAETEFKQHLQEMYGYLPEEVEVRQVPFRTGYRENSWTGNVIAIGMSSFFVEPIESTAIAGFQGSWMSLDELMGIPHLNDDTRRTLFNRSHKRTIESILDYAEMHYLLTDRDDSEFWRAYKDKPITGISAKIIRKFTESTDMVRNYTQSVDSIYGWASIFSTFSWVAMLLGCGLKFNSGITPTKVENHVDS